MYTVTILQDIWFVLSGYAVPYLVTTTPAFWALLKIHS